MINLFYMLLAQADPETIEPLGNPLPLREIGWVFAIVVAAYFMLRMTRKKYANRQQQNSLTRQQKITKQASMAKAYGYQLEELMAALADMSRQINGQLDTRMAKLEILLDKADKSIETLQRASDTIPQKADNRNTKPSANKASTFDKQSAIDKTVENISRMADRHKPVADFLQETPPPADPQSDASEDNSNQIQQVLELVDQGLDKIAIAKKLDRPVGEIELMISLAGRDKI